MMISLTRQETAILLGATLMHSGVPFHFTRKRELSESEFERVEQVDDQLLALRNRPPAAGAGEFLVADLDKVELILLVGIIQDCLAECRDNAVELRLHLRVNERGEVEALLERLRQPVAPTPGRE